MRKTDRDYCCFSGHRVIPTEVWAPLQNLLDGQIRLMAQNGRKKFLCGGALGFDTLAAAAVLRAQREDGEIALALALPCRDMDRSWPERDRRVYRAILERASEVHFLYERYRPGCMLERDRYMVEHSSFLICYQTKDTGGTAYTVACAKKQGLGIVNLAVAL